MPHTTLEASSWAMMQPPAAAISAAPLVPSVPIPVSTSARFQLPHTDAAEENSGSTAGLQKWIWAPSFSAITGSPSRRATRMCRPPGAT